LKKWLALVCLPIAGLVAAAAVAAGTATTGTVSVCATAVASTPDHTVGVDGTDVHTIAGDTVTNQNCATTTYTIPTVTETVTTGGSTTPAAHDYYLQDDASGAQLVQTAPATASTDSITVAAGASAYNFGHNYYGVTPGVTGPEHGVYAASIKVTSSFAGAQLSVAVERNGAFLGGGWTAYQDAGSAGTYTFTIDDETSTDWTATNPLQFFVRVKNSNSTGSGTLSWEAGAGSSLDVPFDAAASGGTTTTTTTTPTTTTTATSGSVLFDGSASRMNVLTESGSAANPPVVQTQDPDVWTCLCFINNDITLAADSLFGKAYDVDVATGDTNPWAASKAIDGAGQLSIRQDNDLGKWDYYAIAVKAPSWSGPISDLYFADIASLGYQTSSNDQVGLQFANDAGTLSYRIAVNGGYANGPQGNAPGTTNFKIMLMPVTLGQWREFVVGVKWSTNTTGEVQVYTRVPGGTWSKLFDQANIDTYLYGTITKADGSTQTFNQDGSNWTTVIDKIGLYFKEYGGESVHVQESGLTRSTDLATAESTLP
jgi:hypothetical protein